MVMKGFNNFVILGGAGYVGVFLVNSLLKKFPNSKVDIITNNLTKSVFFRNPNVTLTNKADSIRDKRICIINLAYSLEDLYSDTKKKNDKIIEDIKTLILNNKIDSFTHVSSIVLSQDKHKWSSIEVKKKNIYYYAKSYVESELWKLSKKTNTPLSIVRSGNIIGPGSPWVLQIFKRLTEQKPLTGHKKLYPCNATFVGNLCEVIIALSTTVNNKNLIMNCCEFGSISWNDLINRINDKLGYKIQQWKIKEVDDLKPSLKFDLKHIKKKLTSIAIPLIYKGRYTNNLVLKIMDFFRVKGMKSKMKLKVGKSNSSNSIYYDLTEYQIMKVFINEERFELEGMPENIKSSITYSYETTFKSINNWLEINGVK